MTAQVAYAFCTGCSCASAVAGSAASTGPGIGADATGVGTGSARAALGASTAPFLHRGLDHRSAIENDLHAFEAAGTPRSDPGRAALSYADAIRATGSTPERYLAHHYLRYLGDLSGGQARAALVQD